MSTKIVNARELVEQLRTATEEMRKMVAESKALRAGEVYPVSLENAENLLIRELQAAGVSKLNAELAVRGV